MRDRAIAAVLCLALAGCSADQSPGARKSLTIAGVALNATDPFWITVHCGAAREAAELGVRLDWSATATVDLRTQAVNLHTALLSRPEGLILVPASEGTFVSHVERLMREGTPVAVVSARLARPVEYRRVGTDPGDSGPYETLARKIAKDTGGHGKLAILAGIPGTPLDEPRWGPLTDAVGRVAPGVEVLAPEYPGTDRTKAAATVAGLLLRHRDLRAVYATSGPEGIGAAQAVRESGRDVAVYAYDAMPEEVAALRKGEIAALLAQSPETMGRAAVRSLVEYVRAGHEGAVPAGRPADLHTPSMVLTRENVDTPAARVFHYRADCKA